MMYRGRRSDALADSYLWGEIGVDTKREASKPLVERGCDATEMAAAREDADTD